MIHLLETEPVFIIRRFRIDMKIYSLIIKTISNYIKNVNFAKKIFPRISVLYNLVFLIFLWLKIEGEAKLLSIFLP